ncbi:MAG: hypothetical protein H6861_00070 [Rhodospirillales bacterium]|nr:hypothetical protein [Rhodospirillales bacterium]
MGRPSTVWSVPAIHSDLDQLIRLHDAIFQHIRPGDRIVYHGNYTGYGENAVVCIDEILAFRRMVLALPGMLPSDIVYLRGQQELIWEKLLQIQFAPDPTNVLLWMLGNGLTNTLYDYGVSPHDGIEACKTGIMGLTKWTNSIRKAQRRHAGHETFMNQLKRAAFTDATIASPLLFVHAGLNIERALHEQGDDFWWAGEAFDRIQTAYAPFAKVVRGFDPAHGGMHLNCISATVDDGCGFGGRLISVGFDADGAAGHILEA